MNILILGAGGREHAFTHKLIESKKVRSLNVSNYQKIIKKITKNNSSELIAKTLKSYL